MESIGQQFLTSIARGQLPAGGRELRVFPERTTDEVEQARSGFDSVVARDNAQGDLDLRVGHICVEVGDSSDGGYRSHRYEASFEGTSQQGALTETRRFPASGAAPELIDGSWTRLDGEKVTNATYLEAGGLLQYASVVHLDAARGRHSAAVGWTSGVEAHHLQQASDWHLLR